MVNIERKKLEQVLEALENLKEVVVTAQVLGIKAGATGKDMRLGESFLHDKAITAIKEALAQPEQESVLQDTEQYRIDPFWKFWEPSPKKGD